MVSDLLKLSPEQLLQVRNMGAKSAEEIIERVSTYLYSDMSDEEKLAQINNIQSHRTMKL